jgi:hypothetical protein
MRCKLFLEENTCSLEINEEQLMNETISSHQMGSLLPLNTKL